jgi:hypothetical protein
MVIEDGLDRAYERLVARMVGLGADAMPVAGLVNVTGVGHHGKLFPFLQRRRLVVKLPMPRAADLYAAGLVQRFQPKSSAQTREWVVVSDADWKAWERLADEAHAYALESSLG